MRWRQVGAVYLFSMGYDRSQLESHTGNSYLAKSGRSATGIPGYCRSSKLNQLILRCNLSWLCDIATCVPISAHLVAQPAVQMGCAKSARFTPRTQPDP